MSNPNDIPDSLPEGFGGQNPDVVRQAVERAQARANPTVTNRVEQTLVSNAVSSSSWEIGKNVLSAAIWVSFLAFLAWVLR